MYTFAEFKETRRFAGLDGLRGLSIGLVLLHHLPRLPAGMLRSVQENGRYGVSLFFVISGFLISSLLLRERDTYGRVMFTRFFARRALRLFPLYYTILGLVLALTYFTSVFSAHSAEVMRDNLPAYLLYCSNWLPNPMEGPFFFSWSLAAEEQFYTVFGVMMVFISRGTLLKSVGLLLVFKGVATVLVGAEDRSAVLWRIALSVQEPILWGVMLGFALHLRATYDRMVRPAGSAAIIAIVTLLCLVWMTTGPYRAIAAAEEQLLFPAFTFLVAAVVTRPRVPVLDGRWLSHVGQVSYAMYLIHWFVIMAVQRVFPADASLPLFYAVVAVSTVGIATLISIYFEQPLIAFGRARFGPAGRVPRLLEPTVLGGPAVIPSARQ